MLARLRPTLLLPATSSPNNVPLVRSPSRRGLLSRRMLSGQENGLFQITARAECGVRLCGLITLPTDLSSTDRWPHLDSYASMATNSGQLASSETSGTVPSGAPPFGGSRTATDGTATPLRPKYRLAGGGGRSEHNGAYFYASTSR